MEISKEKLTSTPMELDIGTSTESIQRLLESQKDLFHIQIDQLQKIVVTQCKLTGVNPLSQEMAAGALSINIGKRPRDLLNPKAAKYMQSVFSIKDTVSKKESREISALCGVTVTQVREFFAGQRSRVRKLVRLSREKATKSDACKSSQDGCSSDHVIPVIDQAPLNSLDPNTVEEGALCLSKEETIPGIDDSDKNFLENIFTLMRKEETFAGQVKLMAWIMQIQNPSVLHWFLTKGGVMILAAWLSQAALEEQTTVLLAILKVLCHLPLHKALPVQMSAILQTVNRLRFYRTPDISNRAKVLLSRWSKLFVRSQALKNPSFTNFPNDAQKEKFFSQGEILSNEWLSKVDLPEEISAVSFENSENCRKLEPSPALILLPASTDDSNKKHYHGVSLPQIRERRKVLLVEQPGQNTSRRSLQVARAVPSNQGRPMSSDDIQKAKMREIFMRSKYGKPGGSSTESKLQKPEDQNKSSASSTNNLLSVSKSPVVLKIQEDKKPVIFASETSPTVLESPMDLKPCPGPYEPSWEKLKEDRIPWRTAPEIRINSLWRVGVGDKSKEVEIQTRRIQREKETIYRRIKDIPSDPKEPWDIEMDYDDSLTPEIPTEQPPDADGTETLSSPRSAENIADTSLPTPAAVSNENAPEPDLELLAVLLKNPELVFALTSGQGSNLTSAETVKLLDMIKASGLGLKGGLNGMEGNMKNAEVEVTSLPSPTPSEPVMNGRRAEVSKESFLQPASVGSREHPLLPERLPVPGLVQSQTPTANYTLPHLPPTVTSTQRLPIINPENLPAGLNPHSLAISTFPMQQMPTSSFPERLQSPAMNYAANQSSPTVNPIQKGILSAGIMSLQTETRNFGQAQNVKPAPVSIVLNPTRDRTPITLPSMPPLAPNPLRPELPHLPDPPLLQPLHPTSQWNIIGIGRQTPLFDSSNSNRQVSEGSASNTWSQPNQSYNVFPGGSVRPRSRWDRNGSVDDPDFELWSPERSPERSPEYRSGRNFLEPRRDSGRNSRPDRSRRLDSGRRDYRSGGNRRWRDRRH